MSRKKKTTLLVSSIAFLASFYGCADATLTKEPLNRRVYVSQVGTLRCLQPDPIMSTYDYDVPQEPDYDKCIYDSPPQPVLDRLAFSGGDSFIAEVDRRADFSTADLYAAEQQQSYQSLRAYLDPNEWTQQSAEATSGSEEATGNEGVAYANDGVIRDDFAVGDAVLSLLNAKGEVQVGDSVYKLTRDYAYAVHVNDLAVLREKVPTLSSPAPADGDPRIVAQPVETTDTGAVEPMSYSRSETMASFGFTPDNCHWQNGNVRMHGKSYITNTFFYAEAGVRTDWERRKLLFLWFNTWQAGTLEYAYSTASLRTGSNYVYPTSGSGFQTGTASVSKRIVSKWFTRIRGTISGTHTSSVGQCYTRVSVS